MSAYVREAIEYEGAPWFLENEPLRESITSLCRARGVRLRVHMTTAPSSLKGYFASWHLDAEGLWLLGIRAECFDFDWDAPPTRADPLKPPPDLGKPPPGALVRQLTLGVLFPGAGPRVFAEWFSGPLSIVDKATSWETTERRREVQIMRGRLVE